MAPGMRERPELSQPSACGLVVASQIHTCVQGRDLIAVTVEHLRRDFRIEQTAAEASLTRLAPARMIDLRVHVRVEAVFLRIRDIPGRFRLLVDEPDSDNRLDALESVLPGDHQSNRRAVLVDQRLTVHTDGENRQWMLRLV